MELSIKQINNGGSFMADFNSIEVERCHYINAMEERVEKTSILSKAKATMFRVQNGGTIFVQIMMNGAERVFTQFKATASFYHKDVEHDVEMSQTAIVRGDEIIEEYPIDIEGLENGKINLFSISKQKGGLIVFFIINPPKNDDYYYRVRFE